MNKKSITTWLGKKSSLRTRPKTARKRSTTLRQKKTQERRVQFRLAPDTAKAPTQAHKRVAKSQKKAGARLGLNQILTSGQEPDRILIAVVAALAVFGVVMIASAGVNFGVARFGDGYFFFKRQLVGVFIGAAALLVLQRIDYHVWRRWAFMIYVASVMLLTLVFIPGLGTTAYGATRWINLGPFTVQPSEAVKLALIFYLAALFAGKGRSRVQDMHEGFVPFLMVLGVTCFLILNQPDVGTMGMIAIIATAMFFVAGAQLKHIAAMVVMGIGLLGVLIKIAPYRLNRFMTFLNPELDPQGTGYQINQALLAIGTGGVFGLGLGHSRQKNLYLPESVGDSIFAIVAEELGLFGCIIVLGLFLLFAWRGIKIATGAPDMFGHLLAVGIVVWIVGQAFINIMAITGLMPLTGITLPFVSYGGSSVVFVLAAVGVLLNISRQSKL